MVGERSALPGLTSKETVRMAKDGRGRSSVGKIDSLWASNDLLLSGIGRLLEPAIALCLTTPEVLRMVKLGRPTKGIAAADDDDDLVVEREIRDLKCPLSLRMMKDPYSNHKCQHTFEKSAIMDFLRTNGGVAKCPVCTEVRKLYSWRRICLLTLCRNSEHQIYTLTPSCCGGSREPKKRRAGTWTIPRAKLAKATKRTSRLELVGLLSKRRNAELGKKPRMMRIEPSPLILPIRPWNRCPSCLSYEGVRFRHEGSHVGFAVEVAHPEINACLDISFSCCVWLG